MTHGPTRAQLIDQLTTANERADEALARMDEYIRENTAAGGREVLWKQTESALRAQIAAARAAEATFASRVTALERTRDTSTNTIVRHRVAFQRLRRSWLWQWGLLPREVHKHMREEGI